VQAEVARATGWIDNGVHVQNFAITRKTVMPAILVECGFISNAAQEEQLRQVAVRGSIAFAIAKGIAEYLGLQAEPVKDWKQLIMDEAVKQGLIDPGKHQPDEPAPKWFVLAVALDVLNKLK